MQIRVLPAALFGLFLFASSGLGQTNPDTIPPQYAETEEMYEIPCPYSLNSTFQNNYQPVYAFGHSFDSEWRSISSNFPLSSHNWYSPLGASDLISTDQKVRWEDAMIQVHCWMYHAMYFYQRHYDHVASAGRIVELCGGKDGPGIGIESAEMYASDYDPYASTYAAASCNGSGGGSDGGSSGNGLTCTWEYMEIEISGDGGQTWEPYWSGYAQVCDIAQS